MTSSIRIVLFRDMFIIFKYDGSLKQYLSPEGYWTHNAEVAARYHYFDYAMKAVNIAVGTNITGGF